MGRRGSTHRSTRVSELHGNVARIAGILHVARHSLDDPANCVVSLQDVEAAIRLGEALVKALVWSVHR